MSRSRYQAVPQCDTETIDLTPISSSNYNYNTADIPIPSSPPPSFHSSQSIISEYADTEHERVFNNITPTTSAPNPGSIAITTARDDALIQSLHKRVERLEESLGRLLLEKSEHICYSPNNDSSAGTPPHRSNCCVTFPSDLSAIDQQRLISSSSSNCCVSFSRQSHTPEAIAKRRQERHVIICLVAAAFLVFCFLGWIALVVWLRHRLPDCGKCGGEGGGAWSFAGPEGAASGSS